MRRATKLGLFIDVLNMGRSASVSPREYFENLRILRVPGGVAVIKRPKPEVGQVCWGLCSR